MSESFLTAAFLSISGGLQDAYTYIYRGEVFANAQTGNIVLLGLNIAEGHIRESLYYLLPIVLLLVAMFMLLKRGSWIQVVKHSLFSLLEMMNILFYSML